MILLAISLLAIPTDYAFIIAQEDFVIATTQPSSLMSHAFPPHIVESVEQLGSNCYKCRKYAERELAEMGQDAVPPLWWGTQNPIPAISYASWKILRKIGYCQYCGNTGRCPGDYDDRAENPTCGLCDWSRNSHENKKFFPTCTMCPEDN